MARIKRAMMTRKRRKKTLKMAKGYFGAKSKRFKMAKQAVMKSGNYAYIGRKQKKRDFRRLWITRISAACKLNGMNYSQFMNGLKKAGDQRCCRLYRPDREGQGCPVKSITLRPILVRQDRAGLFCHKMKSSKICLHLGLT